MNEIITEEAKLPLIEVVSEQQVTPETRFFVEHEIRRQCEARDGRRLEGSARLFDNRAA